MFCHGCKKETDPKDFLPGHKQCYKCIYKKKMKLLNANDKKRCKECGSSVFSKNKIVYCSQECANIGAKKSRHESWIVKYYGAPGLF